MHIEDPVFRQYLVDQRKTYAILSVALALIAAFLFWSAPRAAAPFIIGGCVPALWLFYAVTVYRVHQGLFLSWPVERSDFEYWMKKNSATPVREIHLD